MTDPLPTGEHALWSRRQRLQLDRCVSCERHPETQGHHDSCPTQTERTAR